jgi:hypothetical protein
MVYCCLLTAKTDTSIFEAALLELLGRDDQGLGLQRCASCSCFLLCSTKLYALKLSSCCVDFMLGLCATFRMFSMIGLYVVMVATSV